MLDTALTQKLLLALHKKIIIMVKVITVSPKKCVIC